VTPPREQDEPEAYSVGHQPEVGADRTAAQPQTNTAMPSNPSIAVALLFSITWVPSVRVRNITNYGPRTHPESQGDDRVP
jgi:hypothetical protein